MAGNFSCLVKNPGPVGAPPWHVRLNVLNTTLVLFLLAVIACWPAMRGSGREVDYLGSALRLLDRFFPPDFSILPAVLHSLLETIRVAVMATFFSILLSFPIAIAGARTLSPGWLVALARMLMNIIRTIPSLIWALLAVAIVGPNPLAGIIALTFYSIGYLGKFFSDAFESMDLEVAEGLESIGAGRIQSFQYGLWPHAKPLVWSYSLWMLEYNIRSAAIIGYVGAGGVGVLLHTYQEYVQWNRFCTVLLCILLLVTILDLLGESVRGRLTRKSSLRKRKGA